MILRAYDLETFSNTLDINRLGIAYYERSSPRRFGPYVMIKNLIYKDPDYNMTVLIDEYKASYNDCRKFVKVIVSTSQW